MAAVMGAWLHMKPASTRNLEPVLPLQLTWPYFTEESWKHWLSVTKQALHFLKIFLHIWWSSAWTMNTFAIKIAL